MGELSNKLQEGISRVLNASFSNVNALETALKIQKVADQAYHNGPEPIVSDKEYDRLIEWVTQAGKVQSKDTEKVGATPTVNAPYTKVKHPVPITSLNKSKSTEELREYFFEITYLREGDNIRDVIVMPKLDGLTIVLRYEDGVFTQAVTRGDGEVGEDVTHTVRGIKNIPHKLDNPNLMGTVYVRGEAVISKENFEPHSKEFKNPRNLVAGVIRTKDTVKASKFKAEFILFDCLRSASKDCAQSKRFSSLFKGTFSGMLKAFESEGFTVVEHETCLTGWLPDLINKKVKQVENYPISLDGLVIRLNNTDIADACEKEDRVITRNPKSARAFKWADTLYRTKVTGVIWSASRTGTLTPVITLEPVEIDGTLVKQASVHNLSIMGGLKLGVGDIVSVYKANMIIPQIYENHTKSNSLKLPKCCPVCSGGTTVKKTETTTVLFCGNPNCAVKNTKSLEHFARVMDIQGLGGKTIEVLVGATTPILTDFASIYKLETQGGRCMEEVGMGAKTYSNLIGSINETRGVSLDKVLAALGIHGLGLSTARLICEYIDDKPKGFLELTYKELTSLNGVGPKTAEVIINYIGKNSKSVLSVFNEIYRESGSLEGGKVKPKGIKAESIRPFRAFEGQSFVITGRLHIYKKRAQLEQAIRDHGGSIESKMNIDVSYLINNDTSSRSEKNQRAIEWGTPIVDEQWVLSEIDEWQRF
jgi:DNA ligase (NAD+)